MNELRSRAINWADALAARSGEAVRIATVLDGRALVVHHVFRPDDTLQTLDVGTLLPLHATALGKILLAFDANAAAMLADDELEPFSRKTITSRHALTRALAHIRDAGWADEVEELTVGRGRRRGADPWLRRSAGRLDRGVRRGRAGLRHEGTTESGTGRTRARRGARGLPRPRRLTLVSVTHCYRARGGHDRALRAGR